MVVGVVVPMYEPLLWLLGQAPQSPQSHDCEILYKCASDCWNNWTCATAIWLHGACVMVLVRLLGPCINATVYLLSPLNHHPYLVSVRKRLTLALIIICPSATPGPRVLVQLTNTCKLVVCLFWKQNLKGPTVIYLIQLLRSSRSSFRPSSLFPLLLFGCRL